MSYPHYTNCAAPGQSYSWSLVGTTLGNLIVNVFLIGFPFGLIATLGLASLGCGIGVGVLISLSVTAYQFKYWYYNKRLMCIDEKRCMIGTMVGNSHVSFDGDSKFDMLTTPVDIYMIENNNIYYITKKIFQKSTFNYKSSM